MSRRQDSQKLFVRKLIREALAEIPDVVEFGVPCKVTVLQPVEWSFIVQIEKPGHSTPRRLAINIRDVTNWKPKS